MRTKLQREVNKYNVYRRNTSSRREAIRQIRPVAETVPSDLLETKRTMLQGVTGCVYCGDMATSTDDHIEPLVCNGLPSGLICTALDTVPCCTWCNSSKGCRTWQVHMKRLEDTGRLAKDHAARKKVIAAYDTWRRGHAQRWDVAPHEKRIRSLTKMIDACHCLMQHETNSIVRDLFGERGVYIEREFMLDGVRSILDCLQ